MRKLISTRLAGNILLAAMGLLLLFHLLVLFGVIPADIVWGGMIDSESSNLIALEIIALAVTLLFMLIIAAKTGYIRSGRFAGLVMVGMWIFFAYLVVNTLGNLASGVSFENLVFAPITIILAFCAYRLAIEHGS
ncbi:MAG TPA: hypothetical protein VFO91_10065 [Anaerolineales bacterium]|nr:hypothetical protein [Anaerolineales bacterium]